MAEDLWQRMHSRPRRRAGAIARHTLPVAPGAYVWYRGPDPAHLGHTDDLRGRIWNDDLSRSPTLSTSRFRRQVAEHVGIGSAEEIHNGHRRLGDEELARVREWIGDCELAWIECESADEAQALAHHLIETLRPA